MANRPGFLVLWLVLSLPGFAQELPDADAPFQRLVDQASRMDVTKPAQETLDFLDSLQNRLNEASPEQRAQLDLIRARAHILTTEYDTALNLLETLMGRELSPRHRLRAYELAANLALHIDRYQIGFEYLNRGMVLQEQVDDPALKSGIFGLAAYWHSQLGDEKKGLEYGQRTMELARETGDLRELCVAYEKLGQAEELNGLFEEALARYQEGLQQCEAAQDPVFVGVMNTLMGRVLFRLGRYAEAEHWMQQGIEKTAESGFEDGVTDSMTRYGELLLELGRGDEARRMLLDVLERTRDGGRPNNRADAQRLLAQMSFQSQDYQKAWEYLSAYLEAREEVFDIERARIIAFQEVEFDMHNQAQELELLREQARVSELQENSMQQQRRFQQIVITMAAFIFVLLLLLLIRTLRDRRHFRHMSAHDGLTGLLNHTHFIDAAKTGIKQASSGGEQLTLVLADVDHFKRFNDRHGHQAGDEVLRKAASRFRDVLAPYGVVGRVGGEEFAAFLSGIAIEDVARKVDEVRAALLDCRLSDVEQTVTMSFGVAQLQPSESFESLRARADAALYQAKNAGRDRMISADSAEFAET
jgi:diguanylate cyclase (GGDEF)-like protein